MAVSIHIEANTAAEAAAEVRILAAALASGPREYKHTAYGADEKGFWTKVDGEERVYGAPMMTASEAARAAELNEGADLPIKPYAQSATLEEAVATATAAAITGPAPAPRKRGEPGEGRARRTKAEMAEDAAADAADATAAAEADAASVGTTLGEPPAEAGPQDTAEVQQADDADEAKEAATEAGPALTHDDVRTAIGRYVQAFGMDAAQQDGLQVYKLLFGDAVRLTSQIPDDQVSLKKAIDGLDEAIAKNPFGRARQ